MASRLRAAAGWLVGATTVGILALSCASASAAAVPTFDSTTLKVSGSGTLTLTTVAPSTQLALKATSVKAKYSFPLSSTTATVQWKHGKSSTLTLVRSSKPTLRFSSNAAPVVSASTVTFPRMSASLRSGKRTFHYSSSFVIKRKVDARPTAVKGFSAHDPKDGSLVLTWAPLTGASSSLGLSYAITWSGGVGGHKVLTDPAAKTFTVTGLDNDAVETFAMVASNRAGTSPVVSIQGQSAGVPASPVLDGSGFKPTKTASGSGAVTVSWAAVTDPNGPGTGPNHAVTYTLTRTNDDGGSPVVVCTAVLDTFCTDSGVQTHGQYYRYTVTAANTVYTSPPSAPAARVEISTPPDTMAAPTVDPVVADTNDGTATIHYTTVNSNGASLVVHCAYATGGGAPTTGSTACPGSPWSETSTSGGTSETHQLTGLGNGTAVRFVVWEDNGSQQNAQYRYGPASPASAAVTTNQPPFAPTDAGSGKCSTSGTTVIFRWVAARSTSPRVTHYQWTGDFTGQTDAGSSTTTAQMDFPRNYRTHTITVATYDNLGEHSSGLTITCQDAAPPPPPAPSGGSCGLNGTTVVWSWTNPAAPSDVAYTYHWSNNEVSGSSSASGSASASHDYGQDGGSHSLTVYTQDEAGQKSANLVIGPCADAPVPPPGATTTLT